MRTKAKFAGFRANYLCGAAAGSLAVALGLLSTASPARAQDGAFLPPSWFSLPTLTFDTAARPGAEAAYKAPKPFWTEDPSTRLRIEYLMLKRGNPKTTSLTAPNGTTPYTSLTSSDLGISSKTAGGFKATVDAELFDTPFEFSGFYTAPSRSILQRSGLSTGTSNSSIRTNTPYANPATNPNGAPFNYTNSQNIDQMYVNQSNQLFGAEANAKSVFGIPGLMLGVRSIYFGDDLSTTTQKLNSTTAIDAATVQTRNFLLGPQIGFEGMYDIGGGIKIGGSAKVGLFASAARASWSDYAR